MPFFTVVVVVCLTEAASVATKKGLTLKPVIGGFILGVVLYALNAANAPLGKAFSTLIIITALLINGNTVATALSPQSPAKAAQLPVNNGAKSSKIAK